MGNDYSSPFCVECTAVCNIKRRLIQPSYNIRKSLSKSLRKSLASEINIQGLIGTSDEAKIEVRKGSKIRDTNKRHGLITRCMPSRRDVTGRSGNISKGGSDLISLAPPKTIETTKFIYENLQNNFLFECLEEEEKNIFIKFMSKECIKQDDYIIEQGEVGDYFYLVEEGEVLFNVDGKIVGTCSRGGCFGELSLLYSSPRAATCQAKMDTTIWKIHHDEFESIVTSKAYSEKIQIIEVLKNAPIFYQTEEYNLQQIAEVLEVKEYSWGECIVKKGEVANHLFIVKEGIIEIHNIGSGGSDFSDKRLKRGDCFGDMAFLMGERRSADVTAITNCTVLCISMSDFRALVDNFENVVRAAFRRQILSTAPIFAKSHLYRREINELVNLFEEKIYDADTTYTKEGDVITNPSFCIIEEGSATKIERNGVIVTLTKGNHFGGSTITSSGENKSTHTIRFLERTRLAILNKDSIESVIFTTTRLKAAKSFFTRLENFKLNNFMFNRIIRKDDCGTLYFVTNSQTSKSYALDKIPKKHVIKENKNKKLIREKNLLASLQDFPFIVNLKSTFQDPQNIYFLYDFVAGGELFNLIHKNNNTGRSPLEARFYISCVVLCLNHFYNHNICYRNLKPENILIDHEGYCKLTDFGNAKIITDKTFTFCGSPEYIAPEVILRKGHSYGADHWALGILLFELLTSTTPFFSSNMDKVELFKRIIKIKYDFPENKKFTHETMDLINKLLKKQGKRLGYSKGVRSIKRHNYFNAMKWKKLYLRKIKAPWIPTIKEDNEAGYFDTYPEPEVQKSEDNITEEEQALFEEF